VDHLEHFSVNGGCWFSLDGAREIKRERKKERHNTLPTMTSLSTKLAERKASGKPIQIGLIGAGKFGSMLYVINRLLRDESIEQEKKSAH
jgi:hypothetical protein